MPLTIVFAIYIVIHASLMAFSFRIGSHSWRIWLLRALLFGMLYDNSMLLLSSIYGVPDWLLSINYPRWVLHAGILPLLTLLVLSFLREANVAAVKKTWVAGLFVLITAVCWFYGMWHEVVLLEVGTKSFVDSTAMFASMERFSALSTIPPIATIFTNIFMLPWAFVLWRVTGWKWLFLGALAIFIINGSTSSLPCGFLAGNLGEIIFMLALLCTERFFSAAKKRVRSEE